MAVTVTGYGGVGEIGGNKFLLEDGETRLFLDFGTAFGRQQRFFNEYLRPRAARGLLDLLALGLIPPLEGLYRDDLVFAGLWQRFSGGRHYRALRRDDGRPAVDAVFISHAHLDHNGDLSYLDANVPIYSTRVTAFIARAMQVSGASSFERELIYTNPRRPSKSGELQADTKANYRLRPWAFLDGELGEEGQAFWERSCASRKQLDCPPQHPGRLESVTLRWWPVDHSVPGAAAFAFETAAGWLAYSGDIRFHGQQGQLTETLAKELARLQPRVLLCEGTHLGSDVPFTEQQVIDNALPLVRQAAGRLVVADFGPRNVERLQSFLALARATGRRLLVSTKDIYLLEAMSLADPVAFAAPCSLPELGLYSDPKAALRPWEEDLRRRWAGRTSSPEEVSRSPGDYILCFSLWDANDLLDLEGVEGGIYLYSNSRAYDEEQAVDLQRLRNWVHHMQLTLYGDPDDASAVPLHASGHAPGPALLQFVREVRPQVLVPIHTEDPSWWEVQLAGTGIEVAIPQMGRPIALT